MTFMNDLLKMNLGQLVAILLLVFVPLVVFAEENPKQQVDVYVFASDVRDTVDPDLVAVYEGEYTSDQWTSWIWRGNDTLWIYRSVNENESFVAELKAALPATVESDSYVLPEEYTDNFEVLNQYEQSAE